MQASVDASDASTQESLFLAGVGFLYLALCSLVVATGAMRVHVDLQPYRIRVFRPGGQLISADEPVFNLVYIPGQRVRIRQTVSYSGTVSRLDVSVLLPAGWSYLSSDEAAGQR